MQNHDTSFLSEFGKRLLEEVAPYYNYCGTHGVDHILDVTASALELNEKLELGFDVCMIEAACLTHDSRCEDRVNHHTLAANDILNGHWKTLCCFTKKQIMLIADGVLYHRGSYEGERPHDFSNLIASADRGYPMSVEQLQNRCRKSVILKDMTDEEAERTVTGWLVNKYGSNGYCNHPEMYRKFYAKELKAQQEEVDKLAL